MKTSVAEIVVQQILLDIIDKDPLPLISISPVDFLHALKGERGKNSVQRFLSSDYFENIMIGHLPVLRTMLKEGISYSSKIPNADVFQEELVGFFRKICSMTPPDQREHARELRAWVAGNGVYPELN